MNYIEIKPKRVCTRCECENEIGADNCRGCGATFRLHATEQKQPAYGTTGIPLTDKEIGAIMESMRNWDFTKAYEEHTRKTQCLLENVKPNEVTGIACTCPKCSVYC